MKRLVPSLLILILLLTALTSCAPATGPGSTSSPSERVVVSDEATDTLGPSLILVDTDGTKTYGVYYFTNKYLQHCTVVADIFNASYDSNSAPVITCQ